jgi:hypothetical protein
LIGLAYLQANQKNYGLAAETAGRFFDRVRKLANQTQDAAIPGTAPFLASEALLAMRRIP